MQKEKSNTADRELRISRLLNAPIELVWEVWTTPEHIKNWWGPSGFTNTINAMDVVAGGEWDFVMHGPDGTNYHNRSIFKEIVPYKKIVYDHVSYPKQVVTINFKKQEEQTLITWHMDYKFHNIHYFQLKITDKKKLF